MPSSLGSLSNTQVESLALALGQEVYLDICRWHLYLRDAKLEQTVAVALAPLLLARNLDLADITKVLQGIPIAIGGNQRQIPLADLLPQQSMLNVLEILERYGKEWI